MYTREGVGNGDLGGGGGEEHPGCQNHVPVY